MGSMKGMPRSPVILIAVLFILGGCASETQVGETPEIGSTVPSTVEEQGFYEGSAAEDRLAVAVQDFSSNAYGDLLVLGMLTNQSDVTLGNAEVQLDFLNSSGQIIFSDDLMELAAGLTPGESLPFSSLLHEQYAPVDRVEGSVLRVERFPDDAVTLAFEHVTYSEYSNGVLHVVGEVKNPSQDPVVVSLLRGAAYNNEGDLVAVLSCKVCPRSIGAGDAAPFSLLYYDFMGSGGVRSDYEIFGSGVPAALPEVVEITIEDTQYTFSDAMNTFHIVGEVVNEGDSPAQANLFAGLYDGAGNLVDASITNVVPDLLPAGTAGYFDFKFSGSYKDEPIAGQGLTWSIGIDPFGSVGFVEGQDVVVLETREDDFTSEGFGVVASGYVVNTSEIPIDLVHLAVVLRNKMTGQVVGLGNSDIPGPFEPGDGAPYELLIFSPLDMDAASLDFVTLAVGRNY